MFVFVLVPLLFEKSHFRKLMKAILIPLQSPVITRKDGLHLLMLLKSFSNLDENKSNSLLFWLGQR